MSGNPKERVFKQSAKYRLVFPALTLGLLVAAVATTYAIVLNGMMDELLALCVFAWINAVFIGFLSRSFLRTVTVDSHSITESGLFESRTILFHSVAQLQIQSARQRVTVTDINGSITYGRSYSEIDELIELLEARIGPYLKSGENGDRESPTSARTEYRYPKTDWRTRTIIYSASAVVLAVFSGIILPAMGPQGWPSSDGRWIAVVYFCTCAFCVAAAILNFQDRKTWVLLENDAIAYVKRGNTTRIAYKDIERIERRSAWQSDDDIVIMWGDRELELPDEVEEFDKLVKRLNEIVPITRPDMETVRFPVEVRFRFWWGAPAILLGSALPILGAAAYGGYLLLNAKSISEAASAAVCALLAVGFGSWLIAVCIRCVTLYPQRAYFDENRIALVLAFGRREYTPDQVEHVRLREERSHGSTDRRLELRIAGRDYRFHGGYLSVAIVPLYELLCKTYRPEGYREPGVTLNRTRADADRGPGGADSAGE